MELIPLNTQLPSLMAPPGAYFNPNFITAIDWGSRYPISIFNSFGQGYNFPMPYSNEILWNRKSYRYALEKLRHAGRKSESAHYIHQELRELELEYKYLVNIGCFFLATTLINSLPYGSVLAVESQEAFLKKNLSLEHWINKHNINYLYGYLRRLAYDKGIRIIETQVENTSHMCPNCGYTHARNRNHTTHKFICQHCKFTQNDDVVAAINIYHFAEDVIHPGYRLDIRNVSCKIDSSWDLMAPEIPALDLKKRETIDMEE